MTADNAIKLLQKQLIESQDFTELDFCSTDKIKIWVGTSKCVIRCKEDLKNQIRKRMLQSMYNSIKDALSDETDQTRSKIIISHYVKV